MQGPPTFAPNTSGTCCMLTHMSLTPFALLGRCHLNVGQPHVSGLVLDEQQADQRERHANHTGRRQYGPPAVGLAQHRGDDGAQAAGQVHAAGQDGPPGAKLGGLEPLWGGRGGDGERLRAVGFNNTGRRKAWSVLSGPKTSRHLHRLSGSSAGTHNIFHQV